jgi:hypothetical protein
MSPVDPPTIGGAAIICRSKPALPRANNLNMVFFFFFFFFFPSINPLLTKASSR